MDDTASFGMNSSSYDYDLSGAFKHPIQIEIFISLFVWTVSLLTVTGNMLVFASFARDPELRSKSSNLFILNLSLADFIVGTNSLTVNNLWRYYGNWPFSQSFCKFWMIFDYTATVQSAYAMVLISLDRYLMVTMKNGYRTFMNRWKAGFIIAFTWLTSLMVYAIPFIGFDRPTWGPGSWVNHSVTCDVAVLYFLPYTIVEGIYAFCIPGLLLIFFNLQIFLNIRKRSKRLIRSRQDASVGLGSAVINTVADQLQERLQSSHAKEHVLELKVTDARDKATPAITIKTGCDPVIHANSEHDGRNAADNKPEIDVTLAGHQGNRATLDSRNREINAPAAQNSNRDANAQQEVAVQRAARKNRWVLERDKKAATTLFLLVAVYLICWLPFYVTALFILNGKEVSLTVRNAVFYLVWLNSGLNPCLYAIRSPKIRNNFLDLLCVWKRCCNS